MKRSSAGFSPVEFFFAILILTIISIIVLSSIRNARNSAHDAKNKTNITEFVNFAARYATGNTNSYTGLCSSDEANSILGSAFKNIGLERIESDCISDEDEYIVAVPLVSKKGFLYCTDQTGNKIVIEKSLPVVFHAGNVSCTNQ